MSVLMNASIRVDKLPKEKFNGKVVWTDGSINLAEKEDVPEQTATEDLPF